MNVAKMKLNFVTLFDSNYLSRGLAMIDSLHRWCKEFHIYVVAFDSETEVILNRLAIDNLTVISLADFEDEALLNVKNSRSKAEYCWTSTPSTILYCIQQFNLDHCTYVDADLLFLADPLPLIQEMGDDSILLTEHRFTWYYKAALRNGIYCVQFMTFKNTSEALEALEWWRDACLDWCFARLEDGKFGDQKYLDDWPSRFKRVHILKHEGGGIAPWNIQQYRIIKKNERFEIVSRRSKKKSNLFFYHFHNFRIYNTGIVDMGEYFLSKDVKNILYKYYIKELRRAVSKLEEKGFFGDAHGLREEPRNFRFRIRKWIGYNFLKNGVAIE